MSTAGTLPIGTVIESGEVAHLTAKRFNRHTFWCGQSGSGKTYALGVVLEQLLATTDLPIVIFDPNADFVRLAEVREDAPAAAIAPLADRDIRVLRAGDDLRVRFTTLSLAAKAAALRIDPLVDRGEYNSMLHLSELFRLQGPEGIVSQLRSTGDPDHLALALRIENLGILDWDLWAYDRPAATEIIAERPHATVLDLGGYESPDESLIVALSVLEDLWARREERRPVLLVIDEAHNLCSPDLDSTLGRAVREQIIRIAAEGRKYGLWLLLSTQRPSKVHPGIISQCDNLALMKMSSPLDLAELASVFGYAPESMLAQSPLFAQGQALFAGGFIGQAALVQMGARLTHEGGVDVGVPLR
jgi:DNA helicase HerA-like ATPase